MHFKTNSTMEQTPNYNYPRFKADEKHIEEILKYVPEQAHGMVRLQIEMIEYDAQIHSVNRANHAIHEFAKSIK